MYYIEGTIDAIDIFGNALRFSLLPSSGHLLSRDNGDKKVLFVDSDSYNATIVDPEKNVSGKEVVWFSKGEKQRDVLLTAKNNRNTVRVWCENLEMVSFIEFPIPPDKAYETNGVRVF